MFLAKALLSGGSSSGRGGDLLPQLPEALKAAGFQLSEQLCQMVTRRYADETGSMDFNNFISCLVRLDGMFRAFKSLDHDGDGQISMTIQDWLQLTMYS
uniref:Calpain small subunit 2-like n=1 Tax=Dromaius novaehollandiae TaxID=8790 RepID=A0A8C4K1I2_DRONO